MLVLISTFRIYRDRKAFSELAFQRVAAVNRFGYRFFDIASLSLDRAHENWCSQIERDGFSGMDIRDDFARGVIGELCYRLVLQRPYVETRRPETPPANDKVAQSIDFISQNPNAYFATDLCLELMRHCVPTSTPMLAAFPQQRLQEACREIELRPMQARHVVELTGYTALFAALRESAP